MLKISLSVLLSLLCSSQLYSHGFTAGAEIHIKPDANRSDKKYISDLYKISKNGNGYVKNYDAKQRKCIYSKIKSIATSHAMGCFFITLGQAKRPSFACTPTQEFYLPKANKWLPACKLKVGDFLLAQCSKLIPITALKYKEGPEAIYSICVDSIHPNLLVGEEGVLAHNMFLPIALRLGVEIAFGEAAAVGGALGSFFGPITGVAGLGVGGLVGFTIKCFSGKDQYEQLSYQYQFNQNLVNDIIAEQQQDDGWGPWGPGRPTIEDGWRPPLNWNGLQVPTDPYIGWGWPDHVGNIWIPFKARGKLGPYWEVIFAEADIDGDYDYAQIFKKKKPKVETPKPKEEGRKGQGAQKKPGIPIGVPGFKPPKNWDGKKRPHPETGQYGFPDASGRIWVPANDHGGPHYDVVDRDGNSYDNIYPDGSRRPGRNRN